MLQQGGGQKGASNFMLSLAAYSDNYLEGT